MLSNLNPLQKILLALFVLLVLGLPAMIFIPGRANLQPPAEQTNSQQPSALSSNSVSTMTTDSNISLPQPELKGRVSLEETLQARRSVRDYLDKPLSLQQVAQLLWSAQGVTDAQTGFRTAPSAGATFPLELYLVAGNVSGLDQGIYHYLPETHSLKPVTDLAGGDKQVQLAQASVSQRWVQEAPAVFVFTAFPERTQVRYGDRGLLYVYIEVGHTAQNLLLQAVALELGGVVVGAFEEPKIREILEIGEDELPLYVVPVGWEWGGGEKGVRGSIDVKAG